MNKQISNTISYTLETTDDGALTLYIEGSGAMPDYPHSRSPLWHPFSDRIVSLVVGDGITAIGDKCFCGFSALEHITLPPSVSYIGTYSFRDCTKLAEITFPEGFMHVGSKAFQNNQALTKISFPSTLLTIDIKSFLDCPSISQVFFAGSRWQWEHYVVVDRSFGANDTVLNAEIQYGRQPNISDDFDDIPKGYPYFDDIQQMHERCLMQGNGRKFFPEAPISFQELFDALYLHAGADCLYRNSMTWGSICLGLAPAADHTVTLDSLCQVLFRYSLHNGFAVSGAEPSPWLYWAREQRLLSKLFEIESSITPDSILTRGQCACVLSAYLNTPAAVSDRREEITLSLRRILAAGGDSKFHIVPINLNKRGMPCKAGDCTLLILPKGSLMLIDCGFTNASEKLLSFLRDVGITHLDYLVFSHCHPDHTGGAPDVCRYIYEECGGSISHFWYSGANLDKANVTPVTEYLAAKGVNREDIRVDESGPEEVPVYRTVDDVTIAFLGPNQHDLAVSGENYNDETANNTSLVMRFAFGSSIYLTSGDLYEKKEKYLLATYGPDAFRATIAKANHHGNHTSSHPEWVDAVHPLLTFSDTDGCGSYNIRRRFLDRGIPYYSTGFDGLIHIVMDDDCHYEIQTQHDSILRLEWPGENN